ncbi:MAG: DNA polymerase IV, partial [Clostridia bacterium]|nr:DNA polymerase IV [Clostridia bacterium]
MRTILHCDMNNFYASVECFKNPAISNLPVAVGGSQEARHGIILAKNYIAKKYNIQTGEPIVSAKRKCPDLVVVPPDFKTYMEYSNEAREIYYSYTDQVESFGLDENWLDVTGSARTFGSGEKIAGELREKIKKHLGVTISVGVSYNKIFAKLGSDIKKPDATTVISRNNYKEVA